VDNVNYAPPLLIEVVRSRALREEPFVLVDVGCGLGIDDAWRLFEPDLTAYGFDPQVAEVERLRAVERNPHVHYEAGFVGLPADDPFHSRRDADAAAQSYFEVWSRLSTARAMAVTSAAATPTDLEESNDWADRELEEQRIVLPDYFEANGVTSIDFVKSDTDGGDLEVLLSIERILESAGVLGLMVETPFTGGTAETTHSFHNVDRLMRRHGFQLANLSVNRYSRAALPAPFTHNILAQTSWGQAIWGDLVYLRDGVHPDGSRFGALSPTKLLKLACLYELYRMPDVAAEILVERRGELESITDVDALLESLTPPLGDRKVAYAEYLAAFEADPTSFYPEKLERPPSEPPTRKRTFVERVRGRLARALRGR
jgi:hypothetical protein